MPIQTSSLPGRIGRLDDVCQGFPATVSATRARATYGAGGIPICQCFGMKSGLSLRNPDYETDRNLILAESVDLIAANTPVVFPPGTQLDYEGDGMQVVRRICEVIIGKDWRALAREFLFDPLGDGQRRLSVFWEQSGHRRRRAVRRRTI